MHSLKVARSVPERPETSARAGGSETDHHLGVGADATLEILGRFTEELFALQRAIRTGDGEHLHDYFTRTRAIRRGIIEAGQDTAAPNFGRGTKS